jgi:hypothetical protein
MKKFTLEELRAMSEHGVDNMTIRAATPEEAFDTALHLVELGVEWWSSVHECEQVYPSDGMLRRWWQGNGVLVIPREGGEGGDARLNIIIATVCQIVTQAA